MSMRLRYQFTRQTTETRPYFAYRTNVSGEAGINGNNQEPVNWGPPSLSFASGIAGLADALPRFTRNQANAAGGDGFLTRGRHNFTIGGDVRRHHVDILSQQDPRGGFAFTGAATGSDFADFLLGIPSTSQIAYGNADKYLRGFSYDAYITDDWRVGPCAHDHRWRALGIRVAAHRALRTSREPGYRTGLQGDQPRRGNRPDRVADG